MSNTITLPTPTSPEGKEFEITKELCAASERTGKAYAIYKKFPPTIFTKKHHESLNDEINCVLYSYPTEHGEDHLYHGVVNVPYNVASALIDAAQNPVCRCNSPFLVIEDVEPHIYAKCTLDVLINTCMMSGPMLLKKHLPAWLDPELAAITALQSRVIWKWLESLRKENQNA